MAKQVYLLNNPLNQSTGSGPAVTLLCTNCLLLLQLLANRFLLRESFASHTPTYRCLINRSQANHSSAHLPQTAHSSVIHLPERDSSVPHLRMANHSLAILPHTLPMHFSPNQLPVNPSRGTRFSPRHQATSHSSTQTPKPLTHPTRSSLQQHTHGHAPPSKTPSLPPTRKKPSALSYQQFSLSPKQSSHSTRLPKRSVSVPHSPQPERCYPISQTNSLLACSSMFQSGRSAC